MTRQLSNQTQQQTSTTSLLSSGILQRKCVSCGQLTIAGGKCEACKKKSGILQKRAAAHSKSPEVSPIVYEVLKSPGQPLDQATRTFMESRFSHDFSRVQLHTPTSLSQTKLTVGQSHDAYEQEAHRVSRYITQAPNAETLSRPQPDFGFSHVRVHTDAKAAESARQMNALAYTVGQDIVFGAGQYSPETPAGKQLLAHELVHVIQQSRTFSDPLLQKSDPQDTSTTTSSGVRFQFSVRITSILSADELLLEFIKQYRRLSSIPEAEQVRQRELWEWESDRPPEVTDANVRQGYILITVTDRGLIPASAAERQARREYFRQLSPGQQAELNAETDRQFWERTQYRVGQRLESSRHDRQMAQYWRVLRDELIRQRQAIEALSPEIRDFIFNEDATRVLQPQDYETVLRIAGKLASLSPAELADYQSRVTGETTDWEAFERSIDRYIGEREERRQAAEEREQVMNRLVGLEQIYQRYKAYKSMLTGTTVLAGTQTPQGVGTALGSQPTISRMRDELTTDLARYGITSIEEFESIIRQYETAFRRETLAIADDMLDRYEHVLYEQERRYQNPSIATELYQSLSQTQARQQYEEGDRIRDEYFQGGGSLVVLSPEEMATASEYAGRRDAARRRADEEVRTVAEEHPLLANPDFDREQIARASQGEVQSIVLDYIHARQQDIANTRQNLADNPDLIYKLDRLLAVSSREQYIQQGSIYDLIVQDKIDKMSGLQIETIILTVIAIAAGIFTAGGGTVAVLAAGVGFGISAYQAVEEFRQYEIMSAAYGTQLLSDEPSFAWVIVAVAAAGLDLGAAAAALRSVRGLRTAVEAFNETSDLNHLRRQLDALTDVEERLRATILQAAEQEVAERAMVRDLLDSWFPRGVARASIFGADLAAELSVRLTLAAYLTIKRGIRSFRRFLLTREARALIGEMRLSPEQLIQLRTAYEQAVVSADVIVQHGRSLGMTDDQIQYFFRLWGNNERLTPEQLMLQMDQWTSGVIGRTGRSRVAPDIVLDPESRALLPDFDQRIAGTGGIESIRARRIPEEGGLSVTIEGEVRPGMARRVADAQSGQVVAPNFNASRGNIFSNAELGLSDDWEVLHLWGPGFGDEAAAGMMRGPRVVNHVWQNQSVESYIRQLGQQARQQGGRVRVRATAIAWEIPTPSGWRAPRGELFLKRAEYRITLDLPGRQSQSITVTLDVAEPPAASLRSFEIDPPNAVNLADLF